MSKSTTVNVKIEANDHITPKIESPMDKLGLARSITGKAKMIEAIKSAGLVTIYSDDLDDDFDITPEAAIAYVSDVSDRHCAVYRYADGSIILESLESHIRRMSVLAAS